VGSPNWRGTLKLYAAGEPALEQTATPRAQLAVEWHGNRHGHPSSYGMLAGLLGEPYSGTQFDLESVPIVQSKKALASPVETVELLLDPIHREKVVKRANELESSLVVTFAATGQQGSSDLVFQWLTAMLLHGLHAGGWPAKAEDIWTMWDESRPEAQRFVS
jgi:hypothetical protein